MNVCTDNIAMTLTYIFQSVRPPPVPGYHGDGGRVCASWREDKLGHSKAGPWRPTVPQETGCPWQERCPWEGKHMSTPSFGNFKKFTLK